MSKTPRLRNVNKVEPAFKLNEFPKDFALSVGRQLIHVLATRGPVDIEGKEWEQIFAKAVGAIWKPSNVGLDDIVLENTTWGAKSVKVKSPSETVAVRLISGRNDLINSYDHLVEPGKNPDQHGEMVLNIYNERVSSVRKIFPHVRTVVLIRSNDLLESLIFEFEAIRYDPELYYWVWSGRKGSKNLYGYEKATKMQKFTWQSGGQQFTIFEKVPKKNIVINIKKPDQIPEETVLKEIGYKDAWVSVIQNG